MAATGCFAEPECLQEPLPIGFAGCIVGPDQKKYPCRTCNNMEYLKKIGGAPDKHYPNCASGDHPKHKLTHCSSDLPLNQCAMPNLQGCDFTVPPLNTSKKARTFQIINNCDFKIWVGYDGKSQLPPPGPTPVNYPPNQGYIPNDGGFKLDQHKSKTITFQNDLISGTLWGRTNCRQDIKGKVVCDTGTRNTSYFSFIHSMY